MLALGRWLFAIPFALFGLTHFMRTEFFASGVVPEYFPFRTAWVYITGISLIAASVSMLIGRYDKLAATLLGIQLFLVAILVHAPHAMQWEFRDTAIPNLLKDLSLAGAALMYARHYATDNRYAPKN